jgi:hypothetical protein
MGKALARNVCIPQHFLNIVILHLSTYEDGTECSETSAYKIQAPGNYAEESIQHSEHCESMKSRRLHTLRVPSPTQQNMQRNSNYSGICSTLI